MAAITSKACATCQTWQSGECADCFTSTRPDDWCDYYQHEPDKKTDAITGHNPFTAHSRDLAVNPEAIKDGFLSLHPVTLYHADGSNSTLQQVRVTPKGLTLLTRHVDEMLEPA
ncbi:MAG: phage antirepressor KilAC domain-containing protein [Burkholderiaceae bacterium]|jgi:hypothetical protein|nr:phage antirepressor KilAC domain-containing protein [Burkholderiaceae bacterium]